MTIENCIDGISYRDQRPIFQIEDRFMMTTFHSNFKEIKKLGETKMQFSRDGNLPVPSVQIN